jgi:hypothetical protein
MQLVYDLPLGASGTFTELALITDDIYAYTTGGGQAGGYRDFAGGTVTLSYGSIIDWSFFATNGNSHIQFFASSVSGDDFGSVRIWYVDNDICNCLVTDSVTASGGPGRWTPSITPLPATLPLFASGLGALGLLGWRRKRKAAAAIAA